MKAIIPLAGIGSRLRPHTHTHPKALIPVGGKPLIAHIVDNLRHYGIKEFIFVIGYLGDKIEQYLTAEYSDLDIHFVVQLPKIGTGHAIWSAKEHIKEGDEMFIVLGDTIFNVDLEPVLNSEHNSLGVKKVEDPRMFGVAEMGADGFIEKLVEKPKMPKSNLALVGLYKVKDALLLMECLEENINNEVKTLNEFQLTDGLMRMIEKGSKFTTFQVEEWFDCGKKDVLLETNAMLLKKNGFGAIKYENFENTIIIPPVSIPEGTTIKNSIIGPNVTIGTNSVIHKSIIKNSVIGSYSKIEIMVLNDSLVGNDASLRGLSQSLNVGDSTDIKYN
jgi:glucose-1-phosphate thymidylyltransferase